MVIKGEWGARKQTAQMFYLHQRPPSQERAHTAPIPAQIPDPAPRYSSQEPPPVPAVSPGTEREVDRSGTRTTDSVVVEAAWDEER